MTEQCPCGQPLHYTDPNVEAWARKLVSERGEYATVTTPDGSWRVSRHYIALHGIKANELPDLAVLLGFLEVVD